VGGTSAFGHSWKYLFVFSFHNRDQSTDAWIFYIIFNRRNHNVNPKANQKMSPKNEKERKNDPGSSKNSPDELKILGSTETEAKMIETISQDTLIPLEECRNKIDSLVDLGLLVMEHNSDQYGHEVVKVRRVSKELDD
jgi:hypothetical protein